MYYIKQVIIFSEDKNKLKVISSVELTQGTCNTVSKIGFRCRRKRSKPSA